MHSSFERVKSGTQTSIYKSRNDSDIKLIKFKDFVILFLHSIVVIMCTVPNIAPIPPPSPLVAPTPLPDPQPPTSTVNQTISIKQSKQLCIHTTFVNLYVINTYR